MIIIVFFNDNEGFISAILSAISIGLSVWALFYSINLGKRQNQIALLEKRAEIYQELLRIYGVCRDYPKRAKDSSYIGKLSMACAFLHSVNSKEYMICTKLRKLQKKELVTQDKNEKEKLQKKWIKTADELVDYAIRETELMDKLRTQMHLLYTEDIEAVGKEIIDIYEQFSIGFSGMDDEQLVEIINNMTAIIEKAEREFFIENLEKQTLLKGN